MPTATVHLRPDTNQTLATVKETLREERSGTEFQDVALGEVAFDFAGNASRIRVGGDEVPATEKGILAFGEFLQVPGPFLKRLSAMDQAATGNLLTALTHGSQASAVSVRMGDGGVVEVREAGKETFDPEALVDIASRVVGADSPVQRLIFGNEFGFDTHVPFDAEKGVGGDPASLVEVPESLGTYSWMSKTPLDSSNRVGDITAGGLRFGLDTKRGLTPWVQPWMLRLACTNGMETTNEGLRVDGRGMTIEEVLADLEVQAQRAFSQIEADIEHFYRLREQTVDNPERVLIRVARERGIPERSLRAALALAPTTALGDTPTMFEITNLITNLANSPNMRNDGGRLILERAGGSIVNDEAVRCEHCHQKTGL